MPQGEGEEVCWGELGHNRLFLQAASAEWFDDDENVSDGPSR